MPAGCIPDRDDSAMKLHAGNGRLMGQDTLNFVLTNWIPRALLTRLMGWFSQIEQPLVRDASIALWRLCSDLDLSDAAKPRFRSLHDCFIRELTPGARPVDVRADVVTSPCDAIVGASGPIRSGTVLQAKGSPYALAELLGSAALAASLEGGTYVTLRLRASMYHRFHAPYDCRISRVTFFPGDVRNVNPPTLQRVDRVFCRNERAVLETRLLPDGPPLVLVPVAAVLVASLRLHCVKPLLHAGYRGPQELECDARYAKGAELGWFQHGSTIIVLAPAGVALDDGVTAGQTLRMGTPLLRLPARPRDNR
jgi:phosphatidylserine decarboxylase